MPRTITVTFSDGTQHAYANSPDDVTPEQARARAERDFGKTVTGLDGGRPPAAVRTISDIRARYPQYNDLSDDQLADAIYRKSYADMPRDQFNAKIGYKPQPVAPQQYVKAAQDVADTALRENLRIINAGVQANDTPAPKAGATGPGAGYGARSRGLVANAPAVRDSARSFMRSAPRGVLPMGASVAGASAGASLVGTMTVPLELAPGPGTALHAVLTAGGGLAGAFLAGGATSRAQEAALDALPEAVTAPIGQDKATRARDRLEHPYATFAGEAAPSFLFAGPGAGVRAPTAASLAQRMFTSPLAQRAIGATVNAGAEAGQEYATTGKIDPVKTGIAAVVGATQTKNTRLGEVAANAGARTANYASGLFGARRAQFESMAGDFENRHGPDAQGGFKPSTDPIPNPPSGGWQHVSTPEGDILSANGSAPVSFANHKQAARFAVDNELGGGHDIAIVDGRLVLRRRGTAPAPAKQPQNAVQEAQESNPDLAASAAPPAPETAPAPAATSVEKPTQAAPSVRQTFTPTGEAIDTRLKLINAGQAKYAEGVLQNRDRDRGASEAQILSIVREFKPEWLGEDNYTDRGAPIIGPDGTIESGNGRMMALNRIFETRPDLADSYREFVRQQGFDPEGMERPVLVRERLTDLNPEQLRRFVTGSNADTKMRLSAVEQARQDASDILNTDVGGKYVGGALTSQRNNDFVRSFIDRLPEGERSQFMDAKGGLSTDGVARIEIALLARAFGNAGDSSKRFLSLAMEQTDNQTRTLTGALSMAAPEWGKLTGAIAEGKIPEQYDITDKVLRAIGAIADAKGSGESVRNLLQTADMYDQLDPAVRRLIEAWHDDRLRMRSKQKIADLLESYARLALEQRPEPDMFGNVVMRSPEDVLATAIGDAHNQGDLLAAAEDKALTDVAPADEVLHDAVDEAPRNGHERADRGGYEPTFEEASFTNRQSVYNSAVRALGLTPEKFTLLPPARKVRLLADALDRLTGIKVEVPNDMPRQYAIDQLLDAHQTLQGMASVLGVAPRALSLGGNLKLKLVKSGKFLGAYAPGEQIIMLPGRSNSFGHEWWHALDYHVLDRVTDQKFGGITAMIRQEGAKFAPKNVEQAWVNLINAMFFNQAEMAVKIQRLERQMAETKSARRRTDLQAQIDNYRSGRSRAAEKSQFWKSAKAFADRQPTVEEYWTKPTEMLARAGEAFLGWRLDQSGFGSEFVSKGNDAYLSEADERFRQTFPKGEDRVRIFDAFQKLMDTMNAEAWIEAAPGQEITPETISGFREAARNEPNGADVKMAEGGAARRAKNLLSRMFAEQAEAYDAYYHNRAVNREEDARRAVNPVKITAALNNGRALAFSSMSDAVKMVAARWGSKTVQRIHDQFAFDLGGDRRVGRTWSESIDLAVNKALNSVMVELEKVTGAGARYRKLDKAQRVILSKLLGGREHVEDSMGLEPLAAAMRSAWNNEWYRNRNAGIDLGYPEDVGYINRQPDPALVAGRPDKAREAALRIFGIKFDRDYGEDADAFLSREGGLGEFMELARRHIGADDQDYQALVKLNRAIDEMEKAQEASDDPDQFEGRLARLNEERAEIMNEMLGPIRSAWALAHAHGWIDAILHTSTFEDLTTGATKTNPEKPRSLPGEADELFRDFYNQDAVSALVSYVNRSVRRVEWEKRFGTDPNPKQPLSIAEQLDDAMAREGVPQSDRIYVWKLVDRMSGRYRRTGFLADPTVVNTLSLLRIKGTLGMLGRAFTLSAFEPQTMGIVTGRPQDGLKALGKTWAGVFLKGTREDMVEWSRAHGFIRHHLLDQFSAYDRFGQYGDTPVKLDSLTTQFFRRSGLSGLTEISVAAVLDVGRRGTINDMAHRVVAGGARGKEAETLMRELGIRDPEAFARQIAEMGGALPPEEWVSGTKEGADYVTALRRLERMTIQNPGAEDLAALSRNPLASYASYSITAFIQSWYRNVFKRSIKVALRQAREADSVEEIAQTFIPHTAGVLASAALLYLFNFAASVAREQVYNSERQKDWEKDGSWWQMNAALAFNRTFSFGVFDPVINSWQGLRWNRDLSYLPLGAYAGNDAQNASAIARAFSSRNSPETNTAEYNAIKSGYGMAVAPSIAAVMSAAPGGPITSPMAGFATSFLTSPKAGDIVATGAVGAKGDKTEEPGLADRVAALSREPSKKEKAAERE